MLKFDCVVVLSIEGNLILYLGLGGGGWGIWGLVVSSDIQQPPTPNFIYTQVGG